MNAALSGIILYVPTVILVKLYSPRSFVSVLRLPSSFPALIYGPSGTSWFPLCLYRYTTTLATGFPLSSIIFPFNLDVTMVGVIVGVSAGVNVAESSGVFVAVRVAVIVLVAVLLGVKV